MHFNWLLCNQYPFTLAPQQQALERLKLFVLNPNEQVFILKGYAGTGKTTPMQHLVKWMLTEKQVKDQYQPERCATTGGAANVLRHKTPHYPPSHWQKNYRC
ncbi:MAG: hypothetical protein EAY75_10210 [Bacteroidetes bacterium]|nr:MAG: hypothetical protein EAY75_10210 [Bacteroidota bacterium]